MRIAIEQPGAYALARVELNTGEGVRAETGAMVAMSPTVEIQAKAEGGMVKSFMRSLAGESFFQQTLRATKGPGEIILAPGPTGDITVLDINPQTPYLVQKGSFLACEESVEVTTKTQGLVKGLLSGEGFFILAASGQGKLVLSSFGAIVRMKLEAGQEWLVDNGHLVAWPASLDYNIEKASKGLFSTVFSGEGLICRFRGPGEILVQSRNVAGFVSWLSPFLPKQHKSN